MFSGTPGQFERFKRRTGSHPADHPDDLRRAGADRFGVGKGGFDVDSIEVFLQSSNIQYVVLDEVHKVVEDMRSVSADVTRQLTEWLRDGSIRGLIGFSGTAEAYRPRFAELGMRLAHSIPLDTLIGYGYVAPFAELGLPFANSARERSIRDLLDLYKAALLEFVALIGSDRLRAWFAEIPTRRARCHRPDLVRHVPRAGGCGRGDGEADARLGEARRDRALGVRDREHGAARARLVRRRPGTPGGS